MRKVFRFSCCVVCSLLDFTVLCCCWCCVIIAQAGRGGREKRKWGKSWKKSINRRRLYGNKRGPTTDCLNVVILFSSTSPSSLTSTEPSPGEVKLFLSNFVSSNDGERVDGRESVESFSSFPLLRHQGRREKFKCNFEIARFSLPIALLRHGMWEAQGDNLTVSIFPNWIKMFFLPCHWISPSLFVQFCSKCLDSLHSRLASPLFSSLLPPNYRILFTRHSNMAPRKWRGCEIDE